MGLNRRIVVSEARCAVRINIDCDDHLAWIAKRCLKVSASAILRDSWVIEMRRPYRAPLMASLSVTIQSV
jgi:hypothetical protein